MRHLIRLVTLRYVRAAPGRTFLTLFGIMLGVAAMVAIDAVNASVMGSFRSTINDIAGKTALTVGVGTGVAEDLLEVVRGVEGVQTAAPVIEETVQDINSETPLAVLAIDALTDGDVRDYELSGEDVQIEDELAFLNDPRGVLVTTSFAERAGVEVGDSLELSTVNGTEEFNIRGTLAAEGPAKVFGGDLLLMDVFAAQIAFGRGKRFDRIDIIPTAGTDVEALATRIEEALDHKAEVARSQRRSEETERVLAGFQLGLTLASLVAIFVGGFIVYNALAIAVAQRRREIGILRALGTTGNQIMALFVGEGLGLGALGALMGVGLGLLLARVVLEAVGDVVSAMYVDVQPEHLVVPPDKLIASVALGVATSFVAAFFPARRAASIEPASALQKSPQAAGVSLSSTSASLKAGTATSLLALLVAYVAHVRQDYMLGYAVAAILAFASMFFAPAVARGVGWMARRAAAKLGPTALVGATSFTRNAGRNAVAIAALGMALANVVNADAFIHTMKSATIEWFDRMSRADLVVFAGRHNQAHKAGQPLPESLVTEIGSVPGVEFADGTRRVQQSIDGKPYYLMGNNVAKFSKYNQLPEVRGDFKEALRTMRSGTGIAASERFVHAFEKDLGDEVTIQTPSGPRTFEIVLVWADFGTDTGLLLLSREVYRELFDDHLVDHVIVYLQEGAPIQEVRDQIAERWGRKHGLLVLSNAEYRREYIQALDSSFGLMRALQLVAIIVAVLGVLNTLVVTVIDRRTEIGTLKAIGADGRQVQQVFGTEGALIGFASTVMGIGVGALFSAYIVKELLRFQMGWDMSWELSVMSLVQTVAFAQIVVLLASLLPMRTASKVDAVEALRYE